MRYHFHMPLFLVRLSLLISLFSSSCATSKNSSTQPAPESCTFAAQLKLVEAVPVEQRMLPSLKALAESCPQTMGDLAQAATQAQAQADRAKRAQILAQAAMLALPSGCSASNALAPAASLQWGCPAPPEMQLADALLKDLDAGTYLFVLASRARLQGADKLDKDSGRVLQNLLLSAAIEAEMARESAGEKPEATVQ